MLEEAAGTSGLNEETAPLPRLSVRRLSKRYGNVQALDDIDFELRPGEVMALLGENGAGKSTLVKILSGLVQPDSGTIEIDGKPASLYPSARSQAAGVAVVHQEYSSVPTLSVAENLVLGQKGIPANRLCTWLRLAQHFVGEGIGVEGETEERAESGVASFASVEAKDELVEVGLQVLAAQPVVDASCPSLEV